MAQSAPATQWSVEEYLRLEEFSDVKHEYHDGYVYAMAGGTTAHSIIAGNLVAAIRNQLRGTPCRVFNSDMLIHQGGKHYSYADVAISCHSADTRSPRQTRITQPWFIAEVLSRRTAADDRGAKGDRWRAMSSVRYYVLIEGRRRTPIEIWHRASAESDWQHLSLASTPPPRHGNATSTSPTLIIEDPVSLRLDAETIYEDSGL